MSPPVEVSLVFHYSCYYCDCFPKYLNLNVCMCVCACADVRIHGYRGVLSTARLLMHSDPRDSYFFLNITLITFKKKIHIKKIVF